MKPLMIYVAGPMTNQFIGGLIEALEVGAAIVEKGHIAYLPQLLFLMDVRFAERDTGLTPGDPLYEKWINYDFRVIDRCDALFRLAGASSGADREVDYATIHRRIPVYRFLGEIKAVD